MIPTILDYARITDGSHEHVGRVGRLTDFDLKDKEYVLHFDKLTSNGFVRQTSESTRVTQNQIELASKFDLEKG